jgi:hypothetical protein
VPVRRDAAEYSSVPVKGQDLLLQELQRPSLLTWPGNN